MKQILGIDISKKHVDVACHQEGKMKVIRFESNQAKTAKEILKTFQVKPKQISIVMEATGNYHKHLAYAFHHLGTEVSVINPLCIKRFSQMKLARAKTDVYDAKIITEYGFSHTLRLWNPPSDKQVQLKQIVKALEDLQGIKTQIHNRLDALKGDPIQTKSILKMWEKQKKELEKSIKGLKEEMVALAKEINAQNFKLIQSIPGLGPSVASALMGEFGSFEDFVSAKQVVASVGLNPSPYQSGSSVKGRGGISKRGHGYLRALLYMASLTAKSSNPLCKALYERLVAKGKSKRVALVAVAHKLLRQAFGVVKHQQAFQVQFVENLQIST